MIKTIIIFLLLFGSNVHAIDLKKYYQEDLTETDKKAIVVFNILQGIDMLQTLEIANNDNYYEKNKIMGKHPSEAQVVTYFIERVGTLSSNQDDTSEIQEHLPHL